MMEILKNKTMIGFIMFVILVSIIDSNMARNLEVSNDIVTENQLVNSQIITNDDYLFTYNK